MRVSIEDSVFWARREQATYGIEAEPRFHALWHLGRIQAVCFVYSPVELAQGGNHRSGIPTREGHFVLQVAAMFWRMQSSISAAEVENRSKSDQPTEHLGLEIWQMLSIEQAEVRDLAACRKGKSASVCQSQGCNGACIYVATQPPLQT